MKNFFRYIVIFFLIPTIYLNAEITFKEHKTKIISIDNNTAIVKNFPDVFVGSSGVVVHYFNKEHSTIVAKVIVVSKKANVLKLKFVKFDDLKQEVLPTPKIVPQSGDTVILNFLYNHALAITPNYQTYSKVINKYNNIQWLQPDLFAARLFAEKNPSPDKTTFQKMCKAYSFDLLYFAIKNNGYFVDCNSFKVLKTVKMKSEGKEMTPFYSRIKNIDASWFNFGNSKITNYDLYYKNLLR